MAHSSHKRWHGCALCKPHKHTRNGDSERAPFRVRRQLGVSRRWSRKDMSER